MREQVLGRPLLVAFFGLCAGIAGGYLWTNTLFALILVPLLWRHKSLAALILSVGLGWLIRPEMTTRVVVTGGFFAGQAHVITVASTMRENQAVIVRAGDKNYRLLLPGNSPINLGDTVELRADIVGLPKLATASRLEVATLRPVRPVQVIHEGFVGWKLANRFRRSFVSFIAKNTHPTVAGLVEAICMNVTGDMGTSLFDSLRKTGTVHIVTASGLHCMIVAAFLAVILLRVPVPRWVQLAILTFLLFFYAVAAGFNTPIIRATIAVLLASFAYVFRREPDGVSALSAAGIITLMVEPEVVASLGFQLSNVAVLSLLMFSSWPKECATATENVVQSITKVFQSNCLVTATIAPLVAYHFGIISVVSILTNLLVVPVVPLIVVGALAAYGLAIIPPISFILMRYLVEPQSGWVLFCVESTAAWPWSTLEVPKFSPYWLVFIYACIGMLWTFKKRPAAFTNW